MDLIDGMRAFTHVVATGSFTRGAERLGVSKKLVSKYIAALEDRLGARLLNRTTRSLSLTEAGTLYHQRCLQLLDDLDELELSLQTSAANPRGRLSVSAPTTFGEMHLVQHICGFREKFPNVTIDLRLNDRHVNLVDEGFDVAVRIGHLPSSGLVARKLAQAPITLCAAPDYLAVADVPEHPEDLKNHECIIDTNIRSGANWPFVVDGKPVNVPVSGSLAVNSARAARDFALVGGGIARCPTYVVGPDLRSGRLVPLLAQFGSDEFDIFAVYSSTRNLAPKVRGFVDYLSKAFKGTTTFD